MICPGHKSVILLLFLVVFLSPGVASAAVSPPEELNKWKAWLLEEHPDIDCPGLGSEASQKSCAWPGTLNIRITRTGADFSQTWTVYGETWLDLPGDAQRWPQGVELNDKAAAVLEHDNRPALFLKPGRYRITGAFRWQERPQYLQIPQETALMKVSVDGKELDRPNIDQSGRLWFKRPGVEEAAKKGDSVKVEVFRSIHDGVPITMDTVLRLAVAGKPRELLMGRLLLEDSEVTRFNSPLPARIEDDGQLRIQVRAGTWAVNLSSRFTGNVSQLKMEQKSADWPKQEIWSFTASPNLRGVKITGVQALDPSQLDMPGGWGKLPTYLVEPDSVFTLEEQYRGDVAPSANQIKSSRTLWLDFDGQGATVKDDLSGQIYQGWRLSVQPSMQLGRVTVNGDPQLVTRLGKDGSDGVEIRQRNFTLEGISRLKDRGAVTATGWRHDVDALSMTVNLPPGWRLWHAAGPDKVNDSWLSSWDLWDLFLCLLIVGAVFKLLGLPWSLLAALTLALTYHEANAPVISWVVLIVVVPLLRVLPRGWFRKTMVNLGYLTLLVLIAVVLVFSVQQVRRGLYPQLEQKRAINVQSYAYSQKPPARTEQPAAPAEAGQMEEIVVAKQMADRLEKKAAPQLGAVGPQKFKQQRYQPRANTQTGPGEPTWNWNRVLLTWSGPVKADAPLKLYLTPPGIGRVLMFLQVLLVGALAFGFARMLITAARRPPGNHDDDGRNGATAAAAALLVIGVFGGMTPRDVSAEAFPPQYLMKEWAQRLLQAPRCAPDCAAVNQVAVSVSGEFLSLRLRAGAGTDLGLVLPSDDTWQISGVAVDGLVSEKILRNRNRLLLYLPQGDHDIQIDGRIKGDTVNIPFGRQPHNVSVSAPGWDVFGLVDNGLPSGSLQLQKREKAGARDTLLPDPVPPFVKVYREFTLDLDWTISTTVTRIAPVQGGITVNIPLLEGESVLNENAKVIEQDGRRYVVTTLGSRQNAVSWNSQIKPVPELTLAAAKDPLFTESWTVNASPRWHLDYQGLTPIKSSGAAPDWLPWPGEQLQIRLTKPEPVPGPTTTVESVKLNAKPGARSTDLEVTLGIRTSLGGDFRLTQPENAELQRVQIDGREIPKQQDGDTVILPLHPGLQNAKLSWSLPQGVAFRTSTPSLQLSSPASNIDISMSLPRSRWPLLLSGPDIGPAMLYWGVLIVILLVAVALGRVIKQFHLHIPVNTWQWVLLAIGMSTVNMAGSIFVVLWFFALEARARLGLPEKRWKFNLMQLALAALTLIAAASLFSTIPDSLLSTPDMQVSGNGSSNYVYNWYQDNSPELLPRGHVWSVPMGVYRVAMLAWSLWLVFALLRWTKWSWQCFSRDKLWAAKEKKAEEK